MAVRCMPSADLDNDRKMDVVFDLSETEWWHQAMIWTFRWFSPYLDYRILFTREWGFSIGTFFLLSLSRSSDFGKRVIEKICNISVSIKVTFLLWSKSKKQFILKRITKNKSYSYRGNRFFVWMTNEKSSYIRKNIKELNSLPHYCAWY